MRRRRGPIRTVLLAMAMVGPLSGAGFLPPKAALATPATTTAAPASNAASAGFGLDLAKGSDFVAQTNFVQCIGASMQMMLNIISPRDDRTARTQGRLQVLARSLSGPTRTGFSRQGASVTGWTAGLNQLDAGPYRLVGAANLNEALRLAATSIRETGKPVGLLVWAGRHAWVMSGFRATADPRRTTDFQVTSAVVLDPLYPNRSSRWGASPKPRQALPPSQLGRQFVPRRGGTWAGAPIGPDGAPVASSFAGRYVIVMPYIPLEIVRSDRPVAF
jgi:hypothetical protein